jgi:hypothetical protein
MAESSCELVRGRWASTPRPLAAVFLMYEVLVEPCPNRSAVDNYSNILAAILWPTGEPLCYINSNFHFRKLLLG